MNNQQAVVSNENNSENDSDNFVDTIAVLALVIIFVSTCIYWVSSQ